MKTLEQELREFNKYVNKEVKKKTGKAKPSNKDYLDFLEKLGQDLLEQLHATHH
jgi:hypothetical protein